MLVLSCLIIKLIIMSSNMKQNLLKMIKYARYVSLLKKLAIKNIRYTSNLLKITFAIFSKNVHFTEISFHIIF